MEATVTGHVHLRTGTFQAGGIPFTVLTDDEQLAAQITWVLQDLVAPEPSGIEVVFEVLRRDVEPPAHPWTVRCDGRTCESAVAAGYVLPYLLLQITRLTFERLPDLVPLHAAAVAHEDKVVVIAGPSKAGKSTLAAWLAHRGWGFLTDEAALIDPATLTVHPFWRPIGVRTPGPLDSVIDRSVAVGDDHEVLVPASTIGRLAPAGALAGIVFPRRTVESTAALERVSPATALAELVAHAPDLRRRGRNGFLELGAIAAGVPAYELRFGDLDDAEQTLRGLRGD